MNISKLSKNFAAAITMVLTVGCGDKPAGSSSASGEGDGSTPAPTLRFSAIPDQNTTELKEKFDPVAKYLSTSLGVPVEYIPATDYSASVKMFENEDILLAWFGGLTGVQARAQVPGARAIVQGKEDPEYFSYFIANADTGLERSDEFPSAISDFSFTFGSESSTSGRLMPQHFIETLSGKSFKEFLAKGFSFSGNHDKTCELVESGQVQVGALSYKTYEKRVAAGKTNPDICKIIWKTPTYADYNFTAHPRIEEIYGAGFTEKLQRALIGMTDPELLAAFPREALIEAKNEDFDRILELAKQLEFVR